MNFNRWDMVIEHFVLCYSPWSSGSYLKWADYCVKVWTNELSELSIEIIFSYWLRILVGSSRDYAYKYFGQWPYLYRWNSTFRKLQVDELLMELPEISLIDSPMCCRQVTTTEILMQTIVWFLWRDDLQGGLFCEMAS